MSTMKPANWNPILIALAAAALAVLLSLVGSLACGKQPSAFHQTPEFRVKKAARLSAVRLRVDDPSGHSYGTGHIIDYREGEALAITCGHIFRDSKGRGPVMVEQFDEWGGEKKVYRCPGTVVSYNLERDLGFVAFRPAQLCVYARIAKRGTRITPGMPCFSVGCDLGADPSVNDCCVTNVDRYQGPPNIEASGAPVEGRSGGALFDRSGRVLAICFAADYAGDEGLYTSLESIHAEMERLGL